MPEIGELIAIDYSTKAYTQPSTSADYWVRRLGRGSVDFLQYNFHIVGTFTQSVSGFLEVQIYGSTSLAYLEIAGAISQTQHYVKNTGQAFTQYYPYLTEGNLLAISDNAPKQYRNPLDVNANIYRGGGSGTTQITPQTQSDGGVGTTTKTLAFWLIAAVLAYKISE